MTDDHLNRLTRLHRDIRREVFSPDRHDDLLWILVEKLGREMVLLRAEIEGKQLRIRAGNFEESQGLPKSKNLLEN